jgi:hypothetical protein
MLLSVSYACLIVVGWLYLESGNNSYTLNAFDC